MKLALDAVNGTGCRPKRFFFPQHSSRSSIAPCARGSQTLSPTSALSVNELLTLFVLPRGRQSNGEDSDGPFFTRTHPRARIRDMECRGPDARARRTALDCSGASGASGNGCPIERHTPRRRAEEASGAPKTSANERPPTTKEGCERRVESSAAALPLFCIWPQALPCSRPYRALRVIDTGGGHAS